jgi:hypothetical protein
MNRTIRKFLLILIATLTMTNLFAQKASDLIGAWETGSDVKTTRIYSEKYFAETSYDVANKKFIATAGGEWRMDGKNAVHKYEFSSSEPAMVGTEKIIPATLKQGKLTAGEPGKTQEWNQLDNGTPGQLAGAWLITGRVRDGQMSKMTPGARRTMKILSGTRFQWIAYNVETKEFSGTGGGTYTTENGKYTENILFFSRDNSRVGASLQFDFAIEDGAWRHKGLSSKGEPIDEVWTKREKIGL